MAANSESRSPMIMGLRAARYVFSATRPAVRAAVLFPTGGSCMLQEFATLNCWTGTSQEAAESLTESILPGIRSLPESRRQILLNPGSTLDCWSSLVPESEQSRKFLAMASIADTFSVRGSRTQVCIHGSLFRISQS